MFLSSKCLMRQLLQTADREQREGQAVSQVIGIRGRLTCVQTFGHCRGIDQIAFAYLTTDVRVKGLEFDLPLHRVNHEEGGRVSARDMRMADGVTVVCAGRRWTSFSRSPLSSQAVISTSISRQ